MKLDKENFKTRKKDKIKIKLRKKKKLRKKILSKLSMHTLFLQYLDLPRNNNARSLMSIVYELLKTKFMFENN
ncbi:hypothetical protein H5410_045537 [Solanum commersonii]|uniref:Uncharacterized protein n=1 Tax=Solanum commersonii TaxID=4109 RepID=A0A9J5XBX1_SOLCO|nr:hypothetical protein H5410_045537 [Solanum commersonii]